MYEERRAADIFALEEIGRLLASAREQPIGMPPPQYPEYTDTVFFNDVYAAVYEISKRVEEYASNVAGENERKALEKLQRFSTLLLNATSKLEEVSRAHAGRQRRQVVLDEDSVRLLEEVNNASRDIWGRRCAWLLGHAEHYTYSAALNDFTACYHRLLEKVTELLGFTDMERRITVHPSAGDLEKSICEAWSEGRKLMRKHYTREDDIATWCYATKGRVWIRLGSAERHALSINLNEGTLDYYDYNPSVNETMAELWTRHAGIKCETTFGRVACTGVKDERARRAAIIAAAATSMDFRLGDPLRYWGEDMLEGLSNVIVKRLKDAGF